MSHARSAQITAGLLFILAAAASPARAQLTGTTTQLTTNPSTQLDPAISGDLVVFTDLRNGNEDVYYVNVATMAEVRVTTSSANQRLNDVNGTTIVYTDLGAPGPHVNAFDVTSASATTLTSGPTDQNPRIDGATVVFERGVSGAADVYAVDTGTLAITPIASAAANELNPVVSGARVVYERRATPSSPSEIVLFDTSTNTETVLGDSMLDDRRPDIDGDLVVWDVLTPAGDLDIMVHDLSTGLGKTLALAGNQRAAHVSGRVVAFDDDSSGTSDVMVHHVDWLVTAPIAAGPGTEFLNDIDGGRVVYTSNAAGNFDIWMFEFVVEPPTCEVSDDLCVDTTGFSSVHESTHERSGHGHGHSCDRSGDDGDHNGEHGGGHDDDDGGDDGDDDDHGGEHGGGHDDDDDDHDSDDDDDDDHGGKPQTDTETFAAAAGPAVLVVHNNGCSSAVATLNGVEVILPSDLNQQVTCFTRDVTLAADNTLEVEVRSNPGCSIDVSILTEDECAATTTASAASCDASALGGPPAALCGLVFLVLARARRRR